MIMSDNPDKLVLMTLLKIKSAGEEDLHQQALLCNILDQMMDQDMNTVMECTQYLEDQFSKLQALYEKQIGQGKQIKATRINLSDL